MEELYDARNKGSCRYKRNGSFFRPLPLQDNSSYRKRRKNYHYYYHFRNTKGSGIYRSSRRKYRQTAPSRYRNISPEDVAVVELSSFQLISMRKSPDIAVVTNLAPNHLDIHKDMQEYIDSKKNIVLHQNAFGKAVLNLDNDISYSFKDDIRERQTVSFLTQQQGRKRRISVIGRYDHYE